LNAVKKLFYRCTRGFLKERQGPENVKVAAVLPPPDVISPGLPDAALKWRLQPDKAVVLK
jgi:hypothetical protein